MREGIILHSYKRLNDYRLEFLVIIAFGRIRAQGIESVGVIATQHASQESDTQVTMIAQRMLVSKISTKVISRFEYLITNQGNKMSDGQMEKIIKTYSSMRLDNVSEYMEKDHGEFVIYRYITKSDLSTMFKRRVNMAKKWAKEAVEREREGKIGDALQDYYWSLALLRSCPDGDLETISNDYDEQNMMIDINRRVNSILENISIKAIDSDKDGQSQRMTLKRDYKGKPAANFNYKYSDGKTSSADVFTAKDGIGDLLVPLNAKLKRLKIRAEYEFRDEANIQPELRDVLESLDPVPFRQETINVISSMLKIHPTGIYQKTLGDGLAYAGNLNYADLQRTNMQDLYLGKIKSW